MASDDQQFRRIIDHAQDYAIFTLSPEAVITTWSRGAERIFQYSAGEAVGQNASMIFTPEDQTLGEHERELAIAATEGRAEDERWHVRRDGSRLWASGILNGIRNEVGVIDGFLKIVRDKTNDKRLQESLRASEEQFARVFLANPAAIAIERRDTQAFVLANETFFALIGHWRAETMGRSGEMLGIWADPKQRRDALARLDTAAGPSNAELDIRTKSGEIRRCAAALVTTELNGNECLVMTLVQLES
jgi:PAS domain S-box-containing protein